MARLLAGLGGAALALLPAFVLALSSNPDDQFYRGGDQWALSGNVSSTNAPQAWCVATGAGILIADIDTGADFGHPDLAGKLRVGANFTSGNANPGPNPQPDGTSQASVTDDYGHGTLTAGLMVAGTDNGIGIAAEAPGAAVLVIKVFSNKTNGYGAYGSDVAAGIYWAVEHGARVINLSLGPLFPSILPGVTGDPIPGAVQWAASQGVAVAIAAGNGFADTGVYTAPGTPANYPQLAPYALVVGAMGPGGARASYSQSGSGVNIFAPGGDGPGGDPHSDIVSTAMPQGATLGANFAAGPGGNYGAYDGTSFATPYAAGTLALLMSHGLGAGASRSRVIATAKQVGGFPVLDAKAAAGACPGSAGGGGGSGGGGSSGGGAPHASTTGAAHSPAGAGSPSPSQTAPAAAGPAQPNGPARAATSLRSVTPSAAWLVAVIAGVLAMAGAAGWYIRTRA